MKARLLFLIGMIVTVLSGCISLGPVREYDSNEFLLSVKTTVSATRAIHRCGLATSPEDSVSKYISDLNTESMTLNEFLLNKPNSDKVLQQSNYLRELVNDMLRRGKSSEKYCIHKLSSIQAASRIISRTLSVRDGLNACQGDVGERLDGFMKSYQSGLLSVSEYRELVKDISKLSAIDNTACDTAVQKKVMEGIDLAKQILPTLVGL